MGKSRPHGESDWQLTNSSLLASLLCKCRIKALVRSASKERASIHKEPMAKTTTKKSSTDSQRNTLVHSLAFRWLELNRPDVVKACRAVGDEKYPKTGKSRTKIELTGGLENLK